jgi:uncharacterized protein
MAVGCTMSAALLGTGQVHHSRERPVVNRFCYPSYFLMLPMRSLQQQACMHLRRNRFGLLSFHDADHGDGRQNSLEWLDALLAEQGVADADGEVWLQCYPRVLGHTFKPVSFWFCHRCDHSLAAIVVEVNNTFGERHCYLLVGNNLVWGRELVAAKVFHVSPFCAVQGQYRFRFMQRGASGDPLCAGQVGEGSQMAASIDYGDDAGLLLHTSWSGRLQLLNARSVRAAFWGVPFMTWGVVARIHWQAFHLWRKRVPFFRKPEAPTLFTTR